MLENPLALLGLILLVPLVILYLIKPKPEEVEVPSLLFLLEMRKKEDRYRTFLRKLIRDPLLLLQLLVLVFLTFAIVNPFFFDRVEAKTENVVLVIDASASMQATDVPPSRFSEAIDLARKSFRGDDRVSIILAGSLPFLALEDGSGNAATALLGNLEPTATSADLGGAISQARELLKGKNNTRIVVISDYAYSTTDFVAAGRQAEGEDVVVNFLSVGQEGRNTGIVDVAFSDKGAYLRIKNYMGSPAHGVLEVYLDGDLYSSAPLTVPPLLSRPLTVEAPPGLLEFNFRFEDDLSLDNKAYAVLPQPRKPKVLLVWDNESTYLLHALNSLKAEVVVARPPVLPSFESWDLIVIDKIKQGSLLPGTIQELEVYVRKGGSLVVLGWEGLPAMGELQALMPVEVDNRVGGGEVQVSALNELTRGLDLADVVTKYLAADSKQGAIDLAVTTEDGTPVISYWVRDKGLVFYLGLRPSADWGNFHLTPSFPIFWLNLFDFLDGEELNMVYATGELLPLQSEVLVKTPSREVRSDRIFLEEAGFYRIDAKTIGVSLLSEEESNIMGRAYDKLDKGLEGRITKEEKREGRDILILLALGLVIGELVILQRRGELK